MLPLTIANNTKNRAKGLNANNNKYSGTTTSADSSVRPSIVNEDVSLLPLYSHNLKQLRRLSRRKNFVLYLILFILLCVLGAYWLLFYRFRDSETNNHPTLLTSTEPLEDIVRMKAGNDNTNNNNNNNNSNKKVPSEQLSKPTSLPAPPTTTTTTTTKIVSHTTETPSSSPIAKYIQYHESDKNNQRRIAVRDAFKRAYNAYERYAMGYDELKPISKSAHNWVQGRGMGMTLVDSLDTMFIMGLSDEFQRATKWIQDSLPDCKTLDWEGSVFETCIRMVGGLLSAFELSGNALFLEKAKQYGDCLLPAFNTPTGIPYSSINFKTGEKKNYQWNYMSSVLSEFGSIQLEFRKLSKLTGDNKYDEAATRIMTLMKKHEPKDGLYPVFFHPVQEKFMGDVQAKLGAWGDSWYEYLLKQWLLTGRTEPMYRDMYLHTLNGIISKLTKEFGHGDDYVAFIAELIGGSLKNKQDHLVCFAAGMLALGEHYQISTNYANAKQPSEKVMQIAKGLANGCYKSYATTKTGLGPETFHFDMNNGQIRPGGAHYILRPETVESLFILYRVTGDAKYQQMAWDIFQAIEKHCKTESGGYSGVRNVDTVPVQHDDIQQSFFLAETLKYLYLIFTTDHSIISLDDWVFNTEAHPLRVIQ